MVTLGIYAQLQGNLATVRAATAQAASTGQAQQAQTAQAASTLAIANEATAVAEKERADEQSKIALARQHAAQAANLQDENFQTLTVTRR